MSASPPNYPDDPIQPPAASEPQPDAADEQALWDELEATEVHPHQNRGSRTKRNGAGVKVTSPALVMVETAFLASTAGLLWLASYYLSLVPWMRIFFPAPIALVYLRWGPRAAWMSALVTGLLLSVLMGPYLSLLFIIPYGLLGVQLGAMWRRRSSWLFSISVGTLISTFGFFFRVWLLSIFLNEDLWAYLTNRISDLVRWALTRLVDWNLLDIGVLGQVNLPLVQAVTIGIVLFSDFVYLFTVHLASWLLLERVGNPIPDPPEWVQVLLEEE
ncbi:DUF2232 domain-containing protein [Oscillatoria sp. FACHB-1407]|uniref:DUF2232 domain-containing protein n=1 Tax=Oscillatoria sp. FACHB-1407 TaxID=2692847 RepID=UPI001689D882|nr:DUF2232 domain-containing protein [Oscillatoria sp. FACHB-1407]MBD2464100.1 DUF2232 domain-containing protein [Oscillatoria sp. FACHB-1407]